MAVDDCILDTGNLQDLIFDKVEKGSSSYNAGWLRSYNELSVPESQLCVPPDPIEDLDLFPNFHDDLMSLNDVGLMPQDQSHCFANELSVPESQLCVPPDPIEDLELFPNFHDDLMSLNDVGLMPQDQSHCFANELSVPESQLCVPPDTIEDLELFPNFHDDLISLNDVGFMPQDQSHCFNNDNSRKSHENQHFVDLPVTPEQRKEIKANQNRKEMGKDNGIESLLHAFIGIARKKARTKNHRRPRWRVTFVRKRCSHCQTEETPLWRNGPSGPKTLCNACGVRFRSGRLVPGYRPATSPTFDGARHSNYHRRILKRLSVD